MKESLGNAKTKMVESAKSLKEKASTAVGNLGALLLFAPLLLARQQQVTEKNQLPNSLS